MALEVPRRDLSTEMQKRIELERRKSADEKQKARLQRRKLDAAKRVVNRRVVKELVEKKLVVKAAKSKLDLWTEVLAQKYDPRKTNDLQRARYNIEKSIIEIQQELSNPRSPFARAKLMQLLSDLQTKNNQIKKITSEGMKSKERLNLPRPSETSIDRRVGEIKKRIKFESLNNLESILDVLENQINLLKRDANTSEIEATSRVISELQLKAEQRSESIFKRINDGRTGSEELIKITNNIERILALRRLKPYLPSLGRLENLLGRFERVKNAKTKSISGPKPKEVVLDLRIDEAARRAAREKELANDARLRESGLDTTRRTSSELILGPKRNEGAKIYTGPQDEVGPRRPIITEPERTGKGQVVVRGSEFDKKKTRAGLELDNNEPTKPKQLELDLDYSVMELKRGVTAEEVSDKVEDITDLINLILGGEVNVKISESSITEIVNRITELKTSISEEDYNKLVKEIVSKVQTMNEGLYNLLRGELRSSLDRIESNTNESNERLKGIDRAIADLMTGLTTEGKTNKKDILDDIEFLRREIVRLDVRTREKLDLIIGRLGKLEKFFEPEKFGTWLVILTKSMYIEERPELVKAIMEEFANKYPELENLEYRLNDMDMHLATLEGLTRAQRREILESIDILFDAEFENTAKVLDAIKKLGKFFDEKTLTRIIKNAVGPIIEKAIKKGNNKLLRKLEESFGPRIKKIIAYQERIEKILNGLSAEFQQYRDEIKKELESISDLSLDSNIKIDDIVKRLENLKQYFEGTAFKDLIKTVIGEVFDEKSPELVNKIVEELSKKGLLTKDDAEVIKKDIIDKMAELLKNGTISKEDFDKAMNTIAEGNKAQTEDLKKYIDEKVKAPKPEEAKKSSVMSGAGPWIAIAALILLGIIAWNAASKAGAPGSRMVSIAPVIGETAKTTAASGSILGSLGGINPLIIILILVALFLLFPKK